MVQSGEDLNGHIDFPDWSYRYNFQQGGILDENQTPGNYRNLAPGILIGNTKLANCDHSELQTTLKAPRKERKPMKSSKRFKIFGSMRKADPRNKNANNHVGASHSVLEERQSDEHNLGRKQYLRDVGRDQSSEYQKITTLHRGYDGGWNKLQPNRVVKDETILQENQNLYDWDDEDLQFLSKSIGDESDLSTMEPHMYGSRSRSQSTQRSFASSNRIPPIPHPRSRSQSNSRSGARVSRSHFVRKLQQKAEHTALISTLKNPNTLNKSMSSHRSSSGAKYHKMRLNTSVDQARSRSLSTHSSKAQLSKGEHNIPEKDELASRRNSQLPPRRQFPQSKSQFVYDDEGKMHRIYESRRKYRTDNGFDDTQSHVSALSMTSPTEASKKRLLNEMLSISFSENSISSNKNPTTINKQDNNNIPNFFCGLSGMNFQHDSGESSSDCSSDGRLSSVAELILQDNVLPSTSSLTSHSTDIHDSEDDSEDDEIESSDTDSFERQNELSVDQKKNRTVSGTRKILTAIQGKLSDCFMPATNSPPSLQFKKSMFV